jgi:hypothetical protein
MSKSEYDDLTSVDLSPSDDDVSGDFFTDDDSDVANGPEDEVNTDKAADVFAPVVPSDGSDSRDGLNAEAAEGNMAKQSSPEAVEVLMQGTKLLRIVLEELKTTKLLDSFAAVLEDNSVRLELLIKYLATVAFELKRDCVSCKHRSSQKRIHKMQDHYFPILGKCLTYGSTCGRG